MTFPLFEVENHARGLDRYPRDRHSAGQRRPRRLGHPHDFAVIYERCGDVVWSYDNLAAALTELLGRDVTYQPVTRSSTSQRARPTTPLLEGLRPLV
jgi:uncharacterized protein YbjT (DUF2867 family)